MMTIEGEKRRASPDQYVPMEEVGVVNTTSSSEEIEEHLTYCTELMPELIDQYDVLTIADEVINCGGNIVASLEGFLGTLDCGSESTITNDHALQHFDKVKAIWGNKHFLELLMKMDNYIPALGVYAILSRVSLSFFLVPKIRSDPSFKEEDIFEYQDQTTMMRNALSILIGYWSNEDMIYLMLSIGGSSLGYRLNVVKVDDAFRWGEEVSGDKMSGEFSSTPIEGCSPIEELRNDLSIKELADKLLKIPVAVRLAKNYLEALKGDKIRDTTSYNYHASHCIGASCFWSNSVVLTELVKALQQSESLVNIFRNYSKRAQFLRCVDRLTRIQKNSLLKGVLESDDRAHKMRGALSVLFGYWSEYDVCELYRTLLESLRDSRYAFKEGDDIKVVEYFREGHGDFEGLRNVLAEKYSRDSEEYEDLFGKIRNVQEKKDKMPHKKVWMIEFPDMEDRSSDEDRSSVVRVLLQNSNVKWMEVLGL